MKKNINQTEILKLIKDIIKKTNKKSFHTFEVVFLMILTTVISLTIGYLLNDGEKVSGDEYTNSIIDNYNYILENYYDKTDKNKLVNGAIAGMLNSLDDDYSELIEKDTNSTFYINLEGNYDGIGIEIYNNEDGNIVVLGVIDNSPAKRAGIEAGDIIKQIDSKSLINTKVNELTKYVQNNKQDAYTLKIERNGQEKTIEIERSNITIKSVSSKIIEKSGKKIGYIYISVFANATSKQFKKALDELENENIDSLIIDVRNNSGGHLSTAVSVVSNFLDSSKVIYQIKKNNKIKKYYSNGSITKTYPIVVLQNNNSASASELLAAALKESYNATIVGNTSYGKGTVQEMVSLSNGNSYKFTTKEWLTPNGNSINKKGIKPDVSIALSSNYNEEPTDEADNQLQEAIKILTK